MSVFDFKFRSRTDFVEPSTDPLRLI